MTGEGKVKNNRNPLILFDVILLNMYHLEILFTTCIRNDAT